MLSRLAVVLLAASAAAAHPQQPHDSRLLAVQEAVPTGEVSVPCDAAVLAGGEADQSFCNQLTYNNSKYSSQGRQAAGNIDPQLGEFFPNRNIIPNNAQDATQAGRRLAPQPGWGGGANVSLGPHVNEVWGVHATPYTGPEVAPGTASVQLSWHLLGPVLNATAVPGRLVATPSAGAFQPGGLTFSATVDYGPAGALSRSAVLTPVCLQYMRNFTSADAVGFAYTSPLVCHAVLSGLQLGQAYSYALTASITSAAGTTSYATPASWAADGQRLFGFATPPPPGTYPFDWVVMADVGQTYNSSLTAQYVGLYADSLPHGTADLILNVGDLTYADNYGPASAAQTRYQKTGPRGTNQQRWDSMFTMWQPVFGCVRREALSMRFSRLVQARPGSAHGG